MSLEIVNNLLNNLKENKFVQNFMKELSNYLENNNQNNVNYANEELPIIEDILSKNNFTTGNKNAIKWNLDDVVLKYSQKNSINDEIYFIKGNKDNSYDVLRAKNGKIEEIELSKKIIPSEVKINDVLKMNNNNYVIDNVATKELQEDIKNMAKGILDKQNINLSKHRKEGHLYVVTEELGNNRFLWDLTDAPKTEFEEVDIPQDLLNKATEGMILKYVNGKYEYYSDAGFEKMEKTRSL